MATILVVDDEQITRQLLQRIIEKRGYTCLLAESAKEARALLGEHPVDLLITDVMMPKETGLDLVRHILPKYPDMAIVMVTAVESDLFSEFAQSEGVYDYIQKPFESEDLLERIASALRRRKMKMAKVSYDGSMAIGLLKDSAPGENRVALLPDAVAMLVAKGHQVYFQKNCGLGAGHTDEDYRVVGGTLVEDLRSLIDGVQLLVKVKEPSLQVAEAMTSASDHCSTSYLTLISRSTVARSDPKAKRSHRPLRGPAASHRARSSIELIATLPSAPIWRTRAWCSSARRRTPYP